MTKQKLQYTQKNIRLKSYSVLIKFDNFRITHLLCTIIFLVIPVKTGGRSPLIILPIKNIVHFGFPIKSGMTNERNQMF